MPGPGGPVNDLIRMLLDEAGHSFGVRPSRSLRDRMNDIEFGAQDHLRSRNVVPIPDNNLGDGGLVLGPNGWPIGTENFAAPHQGPAGENVVPGPGSGLREIQDPNFEDRIAMEAFRQQVLKDAKARSADPLDLMQEKGPKLVPTGNELFVFVTNPRGKRIRVAGPFPDEASAQSALERLSRNSKGVTLDIGPWTPQPE